MSKLTHDINGSLLTISLQANNIQMTMPELITGYQQACSHNLVESPLSERALSNLQPAIEGLVQELEKLRTLVSNIPST